VLRLIVLELRIHLRLLAGHQVTDDDENINNDTDDEDIEWLDYPYPRRSIDE